MFGCTFPNLARKNCEQLLGAKIWTVFFPQVLRYSVTPLSTTLEKGFPPKTEDHLGASCWKKAGADTFHAPRPPGRPCSRVLSGVHSMTNWKFLPISAAWAGRTMDPSGKGCPCANNAHQFSSSSNSSIPTFLLTCMLNTPELNPL